MGAAFEDFSVDVVFPGIVIGDHVDLRSLRYLNQTNAIFHDCSK